MKTSKIVLFAALAFVAVALVVASAFAYVRQPAVAPYGTYSGGQNYGGYAGSMMSGYSANGGYGYSSSYPQQRAYSQQYPSGIGGYGGGSCRMRNGYRAP